MEHGRVIGYYIGEMRKETQDGQAKPEDKLAEMRLHNTLYQGPFKQGKREGFARIKYTNGDIYYGFFVDECQGIGIKVYHSGMCCFGQFKNSKRHGTCFTYENLNTGENKKRIRQKWYADDVDNM